ncbi:MAG: LAGLIDADG family homing endonuclease [Candidatus Diapherotrites archaeon]|nr:LAGLIDADG family homing endonuclease [Candidatus Diapherotrites archaeon]
MPNEINLFDLPRNQVRVKIRKEFREEIFSKLLAKYGSFSGVAKATGLSRGEAARRYFIERSGMPLSFLERICLLTNISRKDAQHNVVELKTIKSKESIKNPKLPFRITPKFALAVGGVLGDGGIEKKKCRVWYFNQEKEQIESFTGAVKDSFGEVNFARHRSISGTPCVIFPKIIGVILKIIGLQDGNKNYQHKVGVPEMLLNSRDKKVKIALLQRLFDDDGTVVNHHNNRCVSFIAPKITPKEEIVEQPKILLDIRKILLEFGIESAICTHGKNIKSTEITTNWEIRIRGKENLQKFYEKVGFGLERKQKTLKAVLDRYVDGLEFYPRHKAREHYLNAIKELKQKNIRATAKSIAAACKRNQRRIREILAKLTKEGLLYRTLEQKEFVYEVVE